MDLKLSEFEEQFWNPFVQSLGLEEISAALKNKVFAVCELAIKNQDLECVKRELKEVQVLKAHLDKVSAFCKQKFSSSSPLPPPPPPPPPPLFFEEAEPGAEPSSPTLSGLESALQQGKIEMKIKANLRQLDAREADTKKIVSELCSLVRTVPTKASALYETLLAINDPAVDAALKEELKKRDPLLEADIRHTLKEANVNSQVWKALELTESRFSELNVHNPKEVENAVRATSKMLLKRSSYTAEVLEDLFYTIGASFFLNQPPKEIHQAIARALQEAFNDPELGENLKDDFLTFIHLYESPQLFFNIGFTPSTQTIEVCDLVKRDLGISLDKRIQTDPKATKTPIIFHGMSDTAWFEQNNPGDSHQIDEVEGALDLGLKKLHNQLPGEAVHPIFIGVEGVRVVSSEKQAVELLDHFAAISRKYPNVLMFPGEIVWTLVDEKTGEALIFGGAPVFENGRLVHLYSKKHEAKGDAQGTLSWTRLKGKNHWVISDPEFKEAAAAYNSSVFVHHNKVMGIEICNDHIHGAVQTECKNVDFQVLMAHGSIPNPQKTGVREGGVFAALDHAGSAKSKAGTIHHRQDYTTADYSHNQFNDNHSVLGVLKSHIAPTIEIAPSFSPFPEQDQMVEHGKGVEGFFKALESNLGASAQELQDMLAKYLEDHALEYTPKGAVPEVEDWRGEEAKGFYKMLQKRYLFGSQDEVKKAAGLIRKGENAPTLSPLLPQLMSEVLGRQITLKRDLAAMPQQEISPGYEKQAKPRKDSLVIGYSGEKDAFYSPAEKKKK